MDLLPLEFAKLERQLASGPAPRDSDDFEFYEELRKAERARADELSPSDADDLSPSEEESWEPADRHVDRPIDRTEAPKPGEPYEATTGDTSPMGRPVEGDETNPDDNAAGTRDPAQEATVGFATPIAAPVASSPATVADAPAGTVPRPIPPPAPVAAVEVPPLKPIGLTRTALRPIAESAPQGASLSADPAANHALQAGRAPYRSLAAPSQSLPAPGTASIGAPVAPAQAPEIPGGQFGAELSIRNSSDSKVKSLDAVAIKRPKTGQAGPATLARRTALQVHASELKSALVSGAKLGAAANQAGPAEWTGGNAFSAFASAVNFANPAGSPGPASSAFGIALPNALPQAGGTADGFSIDGQSVARRGAAVEQIAIRLQVAVKQGQDHINIRLHPAELGRVEVKLDLTEDGPLRAVLVAERSDTLELLQRDASQLERTLAQAGLKLDSGSLNFGLQGQAHDGDGTGEQGSTGTGSGHSDAAGEDPSAPDKRWSVHDGVLDLVI